MFHALAFAALLSASDSSPCDESPDAGLRPEQVLLSGSVRSEQFSRIGDVVVTITGPSVGGEVVLVTDALGQFSVRLPPGVFAMRFEKEGFRPFTRTGLELTPGGRANIDVALLAESGEETVILSCVCGAAWVDIGSADEGAARSPSSLTIVPLAPPFAPGGVARSFDTLVRIFPGLRAGAGGTRNGADPARELDARLDGVSVREPVVGLLAVPLTSEVVDEVTVVTAAPDATRGGSTSGWLGASTLGGGNELHGRVFTTVTPSPLSSASRSFGDLGFGLGGPLVHDRLWFAAAGQLPWSAPVSLDPGAQGMLRLTTLLSSDARIEARYVDAGARLLEHAVRSRVVALSGAFAAYDKRLLLDVQGWWMGVSDRSGVPGLDLSSQSLGGSGTLTALVTAWGHHLLKLGFEARSSHAGPAGRDVLSAFIHENWSVADRIVVLLGARGDLQQLRTGSGEATLSGGLLPRLGAVFDPTQQGRAKIFGWWGRLEDDLPLALLEGSTQPITFASGLRPPAAEAWSLGAQFEMRPVVAGLRYSERRLTSAVARTETGDGLVLVNPGESTVSDGVRPMRLERSLTVSVSLIPFSDHWMLEASARLERLHANILSSVLLDTPPARLLAPEEAWNPELKVAVGRSIALGPRWQLQLGAAIALWKALPETERFRPAPADLEWTSRVDLRVGLQWAHARQGVAGISIEAFDLFDSADRGSAWLEGRSVRFGAAVTF